jgi:hypothetical protein
LSRSGARSWGDPALAFGFAVRTAIGVAIPLIADVIADDVQPVPWPRAAC